MLRLTRGRGEARVLTVEGAGVGTFIGDCDAAAAGAFAVSPFINK